MVFFHQCAQVVNEARLDCRCLGGCYNLDYNLPITMFPLAALATTEAVSGRSAGLNCHVSQLVQHAVFI